MTVINMQTQCHLTQAKHHMNRQYKNEETGAIIATQANFQNVNAIWTTWVKSQKHNNPAWGCGHSSHNALPLRARMGPWVAIA
tara:strand:+ start:602 stop:850 length:249 start_codon:yes stop_codon:yes gene_type:complete